MRLRATLAATAVLAAAAVAAPAASADKLMVQAQPVSPNVANYIGKVKSKRDKCLRKRTIQVYQVIEPPVFIGQTQTDQKGNFELQEYAPATGHVRVVALAKTGCKALEKVIPVPAPPAG
jgi:hypothetical protein